MRDLLVIAVIVAACKGPSNRAIPPTADPPRVTGAAPASGNVADVPAGDSATFGGRVYLAGDTVFSFADYHTAAADIEHLERRTDSLITVASLVLPVRYKNNVVLHACTLDGAPDPEIMTAVHPRFAWRASRSRERFEPIEPTRVLCSFDEVVD
jgi:hypothetical protein